MSFLHTPYASGKPPFAIGLTPLDPERWIEPDEQLAEQLALKEAILAGEGAAAFDALPGSEAGQLAALSPEQLACKGIEEARPRLLAALLELAKGPAG